MFREYKNINELKKFLDDITTNFCAIYCQITNIVNNNDIKKLSFFRYNFD